MARPQKESLDYFSMDVEKDNKLKLLKGKFGVLGFGMYIELLQYIYKQGYYIERNEDNMLLFLAETGLKEEETRVMLEFMIDKDLFNKVLYEKYNILSSRGIQKRYVEGTKKRKKVVVEQQYRITEDYGSIEYQDTITSLRAPETPKSQAEMSQSKVKESKGKESKEKEETDSRSKFVKPSVQEIKDFCLEKGYTVSAEQFYAHYQSKGRKVGKNPMVDRKAGVTGWQVRQQPDRKKLSSETNREGFSFLGK